MNNNSIFKTYFWICLIYYDCLNNQEYIIENCDRSQKQCKILFNFFQFNSIRSQIKKK
jgi:hypothetical protein